MTVYGRDGAQKARCVNLRSADGEHYVQYSGEDYHLLAVSRGVYVDVALPYEWWMLLVEGAYVHSNAFHAFLTTRFRIWEAEYMRKGASFMPLTTWYDATWAFIESLALVAEPVDVNWDGCTECGAGRCRICICDGAGATMKKSKTEHARECPCQDLPDPSHAVVLDKNARRLQCRLDDSSGRELPYTAKLPMSIGQRTAQMKLGEWAIRNGNGTRGPALGSQVIKEMYVTAIPLRVLTPHPSSLSVQWRCLLQWLC